MVRTFWLLLASYAFFSISTLEANDAPVDYVAPRDWQSYGVGSGLADESHALRSFGGRLYVGGRFRYAGELYANGLVVWDGTAWQSVRSLPGGVYARDTYLTTFADELYASRLVSASSNTGLLFLRNDQWQTVPGTERGYVDASVVHDGKLWFGHGGKVKTWDGQNVAEIPGLDGNVRTLCVEHDGVYVGGAFTINGGTENVHFAFWNGQGWSAPAEQPNSAVDKLAAYNGSIYVTGRFELVGSESWEDLVRWDGQAWHPMPFRLSGHINTFLVHDEELYFAGQVRLPDVRTPDGDTRWDGVIKWDGETVSNVGNTLTVEVHELVTHEGTIHAAGQLSYGQNLLRLENDRWLHVGPDPVVDGRVYCMAEDDYHVYVGGNFVGLAGVYDEHDIIRMNKITDEWSAVPGDISGIIRKLQWFNGRLFAGGTFRVNASAELSYLAAWENGQWTAIPNVDGSVEDMHVEGQRLYVAGNFEHVDSVVARKVAFLDAVGWHALPELNASLDSRARVQCLTIYSGDVVISGGIITTQGNVGDLYRLQGAQLTPMLQRLRGDISDLAVHNDELFIGGHLSSLFDNDGREVRLGCVGKWNGVSWSDAEPNLDGRVYEIQHHGDRVIYGGRMIYKYVDVGNRPMNKYANLYMPDQGSHYTFGFGSSGSIYGFLVSAGKLFAGGSFRRAGDKRSQALAAVDLPQTAQTVTVTGPTVASYGDPPVTLQASASRGMPVVLYPADDRSAVSGQNVTIQGASDVTVYAYQEGDFTTAPARATHTIQVAKADLHLRVDDASRRYGAANPGFSFQYDGFVRGDDAAAVIGQVAYTTVADLSSPVGQYPVGIDVSGLQSANYRLLSQDGQLTILPAPLRVAVADAQRPRGVANPDPQLSYLGFRNGDDASTFSSPVQVQIQADASSPVGRYPIDLSGGTVQNYTLSYDLGSLTVYELLVTGAKLEGRILGSDAAALVVDGQQAQRDGEQWQADVSLSISDGQQSIDVEAYDGDEQLGSVRVQVDARVLPVGGN